METKPVSRKWKSFAYLKHWFSVTSIIFFSLAVKAGNAVTLLASDSILKDSLAKDSLSRAQKSSALSGIEDNPVIKYSLMIGGILFFVLLAMLGSFRKSKPAAPPVGYRKNPNQKTGSKF